MKKRRDSQDRKTRRDPGHLSQAAGRSLTSYTVGALPILNHVIRRAKLEDFLRQFMVEDKRCTISPVLGTLILLRNYLCSREPIYSVGDWARQHAPGLLGLTASKVASLNDDRVGRCLDRLFDADCSALVLAITRHVVEEFSLDLSEIHNDSTTITFSGAYDDAAEEAQARGKKTPALTWGFNKDHRPDLKQLLYNLTVTSDGAVPVVFGVENGNVTDDQTHQGNWDLLCEIIGGAGFLYVADSKLATHANMTHIANRGGRFISVLPRTRSEDKAFRRKVSEGRAEWEVVQQKHDEDGKLVDTISVARDEDSTSEGFRLLWFHSTRKVELDRVARNNKIGRAIRDLSSLSLKLRSPRTRYREREQVEKAVAKCLSAAKATDLMRVDIRAETREVTIQDTPGRPGPKTRYRKELKTRYNISFDADRDKVAEGELQDGVFPLVTNDRELPPAEVLKIYKRQSQIEKRFSQLKTQFEVAPVFLKSVHRIVALLTIYYLALLVQALVERELRAAMKKSGIESLPLYPEERECKAPTTRRVIDIFQNVQLHELEVPGEKKPLRFATELSELQSRVVTLLGVPASDYEA